MQGLKNNAELLTDDASDNEAVNNQCIVDSATHICQARAQRVCSNEKIRMCKENYKQNLHFYCSNFATAFDFA